jgi:hypothetical protein
MAVLKLEARERRRERRHDGSGRHWQADAVIRPGQPVRVLNISTRAALVESATRLRPGAHTELQLLAPGRGRVSVRARLDRCHVATLEPLRYRGVLVFDERLHLDDEARE